MKAAATDKRFATAALIAGVALILLAGSVAAGVFLQPSPRSTETTTRTQTQAAAQTAPETSPSLGSSTATSTSQETLSQPPTTTLLTSSSSSITLSSSTSSATSYIDTTSATRSSSTSTSTAAASSLPGTADILLPTDVGDNMSLNFEPAQIKVVIGVNNTIVWNDTDWEQHNIESSTIPNGATPWNSGTLNEGQTFTVVLTVAGTYKYFCEIHPWMIGTIQVLQ